MTYPADPHVTYIPRQAIRAATTLAHCHSSAAEEPTHLVVSPNPQQRNYGTSIVGLRFASGPSRMAFPNDCAFDLDRLIARDQAALKLHYALRSVPFPHWSSPAEALAIPIRPEDAAEGAR